MSVSKKIPIGEHRLGAQYLELRETLQTPKYQRHLEKRLAYWVNLSDKRLPIALLGRTVGEILDMSMDELMGFPSIGEKKFNALVSLLGRIADTSEVMIPLPEEYASEPGEREQPVFAGNEPNWNLVSELQWNTWQRVVIDQGLENEKIGRLCSSLSEIPRVLWNKPLGIYCRISLEELRSMKTHGERRIQAIVHLFHDVFEVASKFTNVPRLRVRMSLRWIDELQLWMSEMLTASSFPSKDEIMRRFVRPCLGQLRIDATEGVVQLAEARLGLDGPITSVRQVAKEMNLARARVYQLLGQIGEIMAIRWPEGSSLVYQLRDKCIYEMIDRPSSQAHELFMASADLFYPTGRTAPDPSRDRDSTFGKTQPVKPR